MSHTKKRISRTILEADKEDHIELTDLTLRSKASWGYNKSQIESWREMLTITASYIEEHSVYKVCGDKDIIGYYSWIVSGQDSIELDNMFIAPEYIGQGIGRMLMNDFMNRIKKTNALSVILYADPNAELFYRKFDFVVIGKSESNIKGRYLPIMKRELHP